MSKKSRTRAVRRNDSLSSYDSSSRSPSRSYSSFSRERLYKSAMSGLNMPVPRIKSMLKVHNYANRVSDTSAVFLAAVLEYMTAEILEHSRNAARSSGASRIQTKHINIAIKTDPELHKFFKNATVVQGGVIPYQEQNSILVASGQPPLSPFPTFTTPSRRQVKSEPISESVRKSVGKSKKVKKSRTNRRSG